jgi:hypothetical protein
MANINLRLSVCDVKSYIYNSTGAECRENDIHDAIAYSFYNLHEVNAYELEEWCKNKYPNSFRSSIEMNMLYHNQLPDYLQDNKIYLPENVSIEKIILESTTISKEYLMLCDLHNTLRKYGFTNHLVETWL